MLTSLPILEGHVKLRINGADGNLDVTVTNGTSGVFGDTSNTDVILAADSINYSFNAGGGSGNGELDAVMVEIDR